MSKEPTAAEISKVMKAIRKRGGAKPGYARAAALTPERRREIAVLASRRSVEVRQRKARERKAREAQEKQNGA